MKPISEYDDQGQLRQLMANAKRLKDERTYWEAFSRLCFLAGRDELDPLTRDFFVTLAAYEELLSLKNGRKTTATRVRQKLKRVGIMRLLTDWAFQPTSDGLKLLADRDMLDLTGEHLVIKYANRFPAEAVAAAQAKIDLLQRTVAATH